TTYIITRFTGPSRDHILIAAILYDFNVSYPLEGASRALKYLVPALPGVSAAPDGTLETCYSEVRAAEQDQVRIIETEAHRIKIRFIKRTLVWTKRSPTPVVLPSI